jgi:hypothetical protein
MYLPGNNYEESIWFIVTSVMLNSLLFTPPSLVRIEVRSPVEFKLEAFGSRLGNHWAERIDTDACTDNLLRYISELRGGRTRPGLHALSPLVAWSETTTVGFTTGKFHLEQTYQEGRPVESARWRAGQQADPGFLFHARMEQGHFTNDLIQNSRLVALVTPESIAEFLQEIAEYTGVTWPAPQLELLYAEP